MSIGNITFQSYLVIIIYFSDYIMVNTNYLTFLYYYTIIFNSSLIAKMCLILFILKLPSLSNIV